MHSVNAFLSTDIYLTTKNLIFYRGCGCFDLIDKFSYSTYCRWYCTYWIPLGQPDGCLQVCFWTRLIGAGSRQLMRTHYKTFARSRNNIGGREVRWRSCCGMDDEDRQLLVYPAPCARKAGMVELSITMSSGWKCHGRSHTYVPFPAPPPMSSFFQSGLWDWAV